MRNSSHLLQTGWWTSSFCFDCDFFCIRLWTVTHLSCAYQGIVMGVYRSQQCWRAWWNKMDGKCCICRPVRLSLWGQDSPLSPFNVTAPSLITGCNQCVVLLCVGCAIFQWADRQRAGCGDPSSSSSLHLQQMKRRIIKIMSPCISVPFSSQRGFLPELLMPCFFVLPRSLHCHLSAAALRRTGQCSYCWRRARTTPATTVIPWRPASWPPSPPPAPRSPPSN